MTENDEKMRNEKLEMRNCGVACGDGLLIRRKLKAGGRTEGS